MHNRDPMTILQDFYSSWLCSVLSDYLFVCPLLSSVTVDAMRSADLTKAERNKISLKSPLTDGVVDMAKLSHVHGVSAELSAVDVTGHPKVPVNDILNMAVLVFPAALSFAINGGTLKRSVRVGFASENEATKAAMREFAIDNLPLQCKLVAAVPGDAVLVKVQNLCVSLQSQVEFIR